MDEVELSKQLTEIFCNLFIADNILRTSISEKAFSTQINIAVRKTWRKPTYTTMDMTNILKAKC